MARPQNISFDHCIKCTVCTVYCPVSRVDDAFPGPKLSGPDTERLRRKNPELVDASLKYCTNCKRCEVACPSDVAIADMISSARARYLSNRVRFRDRLLSGTDLVGALAVRLGPLFHLVAGRPPLRRVLNRMLGVPPEREYPEYAGSTFHRWFARNGADQDRFDERVIYFTGCYVKYIDHQLGKDLIEVLNRMNIGVLLGEERCCGVPLIANGLLERARQNAAFNIEALGNAGANRNAPILSTSSSCSLALKHEYPNLLQMDTRAISGRVQYVTRYLHEQFERGNVPDLKPVSLTAAYHAPCHLERMGGVLQTVGVLNRVPGLKLRLLHSECCGMAGTYGFKTEYERIVADIGAPLFRSIEEAAPDIVITDCESCKWQIEMNTPYPVVHPVSVLARALD
jgi:glycerol-3-phosphate dehydrogenase subunit C